MSQLIENAERDEDGRLICEIERSAAAGGTSTQEVDCTALFRPGRRVVGDVEKLVVEAELADEGEHGGNPAYPEESVAQEAIERIEDKGLEPAWRAVENGGEFP